MARGEFFEELSEIRQNALTLKLKLLFTVQCMTYSGRCLLSNFIS